jgi:molybdate transport system ATP-binding protein
MMAVEFDIRHTLGSFRLDARFVADRGLTVLFGRSGSGKTSLINVIAGLVRPDEGRVVIDGTVVVDTARGIFVPSHKRRVGYVFQESRLLPHLTVRQNLLYGRWFARLGSTGAEVERIFALLGLEKLIHRRPHHLSGGERQRVAIGRALLAEPRLLLMDEPLASLDEGRKQEVMPYLERLRDHARIPMIYVSHSVPEVTRLASTIVLVSEGQVQAQGPVAEMMQRLDLFPMLGRSEAGAVIEAKVTGHDPAYGLTTLASRAGQWRLPIIDAPVGAQVRLRVRSRDVMIARGRPEGISALNVLNATVTEIAGGAGPIVELRLDCGGEAILARLTRYSVDRLGLTPGTEVQALIKSVALDRRAVSALASGRDDNGADETAD